MENRDRQREEYEWSRRIAYPVSNILNLGKS